jgi:hypothetical protein
MGQLGFFDLSRRYESLTEKNDPLVAIAAMVQFESFRPKLHTALINGELRRSEAERRNSAAVRTGLHRKSKRSPPCRNGNWKIASRNRRPPG